MTTGGGSIGQGTLDVLLESTGGYFAAHEKLSGGQFAAQGANLWCISGRIQGTHLCHPSVRESAIISSEYTGYNFRKKTVTSF